MTTITDARASGQTTSSTLLIDGRWEPGGAESILPVIDPATGRRLGWTPSADGSQLDRALAAAERGFAEWSRTPAAERGAVLVAAADELARTVEHDARLITAEEGKPLAQARGEMLSVVAMLRWFGTEAVLDVRQVRPGSASGLEVRVHGRPIGPVAIITPWNYPVSLAARKLAAALGAGCSAIVKPAGEAPSAFLGVARALQRAGLPDGVLGVLNGDPAALTVGLIASPVIRAVSFTGSTAVGRIVGRLAGEHVKPATLELGGHAPVIVAAEVDLETVVPQLVAAKYANAGQVCVAPTRFLVQEARHEEFTAAFVEAAARLVVGPGTAHGVEMGPLALERQRTRVLDLVQRTVAAGARLRLGGSALPGEGWFVPPTVVVDAPVDSALMTEEPFGPVAIIGHYDRDEEAVAEANRLPWGLGAYVFTGDAEHSRALADEVRAGTLGVDTTALLHVDSSLGGVGDSGHGRDGGPEGLAEFRVSRTSTHRVG